MLEMTKMIMLMISNMGNKWLLTRRPLAAPRLFPQQDLREPPVEAGASSAHLFH